MLHRCPTLAYVVVNLTMYTEPEPLEDESALPCELHGRMGCVSTRCTGDSHLDHIADRSPRTPHEPGWFE